MISALRSGGCHWQVQLRIEGSKGTMKWYSVTLLETIL